MLKPDFNIDELWDLTPERFLKLSQNLYQFQAQHNPVYKRWIELSKQTEPLLEQVNQIPFLPISFFKTQDVFIGDKPSTLFESSGTTQDVVSKHWVADTGIYEKSFFHCFELFYGNPSDYCIIGLLPSYLERQHSSLVYMVEHLIKASGHGQSGFYLNEFDKLNQLLHQLESQQQKTFLIGVSFGLIDFLEAYPQQLQYTTVVETGGMKGRKEELSKPALHALLAKNAGVSNIQSEYGMTELLSQAYAVKDGIFKCPPWMKVLVGDENDPTVLKKEGRGILHIIDLVNIYSCAFIATQDLGEVYADGSFQVIGRADNSDRRGCSLLAI
jgi:hypothetical protein